MRRTTSLSLEALEDRSVPAASITLAGNVLNYAAGAGVANNLTVNYNPVTMRYTFTDPTEVINLVGVPGIGSGTNNVTVTLPPAFYAAVRIGLGDGNDVVRLAGTRPGISTSVALGLGNDTVQMVPGASLGPTSVNGEAGTDLLDYSTFATQVYVNLLTGQATNLSSVANFENAFGGVANDILVGNASANVLRGGAGRDVVIGGLGKDTIDGGTGEDLLIGGRTSYDGNVGQLNTIRAQWSGGAAYAARVAWLKNAANPVKLQPGFTVFDDFAGDTFLGGADLDWYWAFAPDVIVGGPAPGEQVN